MEHMVLPETLPRVQPYAPFLYTALAGLLSFTVLQVASYLRCEIKANHRFRAFCTRDAVACI
eukprot:3412984-Rhodomonas_salina.2